MQHVWADARRRFHVVLDEKKGNCEITQITHQGCCACCGAPRDHEAVTMQYRFEGKSCIVYQAEYPPQGNCKSVIEALIMANNVHEEFPQGDNSPHRFWRPKEPYTGETASIMEIVN